MLVKEIMSQPVACCNQRDTVQDAAKLMASKDCGVLPIVNSQDLLVGVVTDRDITCRAMATGLDGDCLVQEVMSTPVVTARLDTPIEEAVRLMEEFRIRRIAVVDGSGFCCGMVSQADVARNMDVSLVAELVREISGPFVTRTNDSSAYLG